MPEIYSNIPEYTSNPETRGRRVDLEAWFMRHGEKAFSTSTPETGLTAQGKAQASEFGTGLEEGNAIKGYSSNTERTVQSVEEVIKASQTEKRLTLRLRQELGFSFDPEGSFIKTILENKGKIVGDLTRLSQEEFKQRMDQYDTYVADYFLSFGKEKPDEGTDSPYECAQRIARLVDRYIKMTKRLNTGSKVILINATHDLVIQGFLKEIIGFKSITEVGGPIGFTEGFKVRVESDESGKQKIYLDFRDKRYPLDLNKLQELCQE